MRDVNQVLEFWLAPANRSLWFKKVPAFDEEIRRRFEPLHERAAEGRLAQWQNTPEGSLALVICLDQFPRNMYRGTPRAFATDEKARLVADWAVDRGFDMKIEDEQVRFFLYLPFEHSENIDDQHRCIELVRRGCPGDPEIMRYALMHREVIAKYGRFPHRNAILGRRNTPEEDEYLKQPGAGF